MRIEDMGEDGITAFLARRYAARDPRVMKGMGDDTAVIRVGRGAGLLLTTDTLIEGTHFTMDLTTPFLLGSKALAVSLSDIAAMGGTPLYYLVSLDLPPSTEGAFLKALYRGLDKQAKRHGLSLIGGNLSRSTSISISTTVLGEAPAGTAVYRDGALPGDDIYLTGRAGDSALGLLTLEKYGRAAIKGGPMKRQTRKHLEPVPRIEVGRELSRKKIATAMIDTSDGLLLDLTRLCRASKTGALVEAERVPLSRGLAASGRDGVMMALTGGEDYELLFTARPKRAADISRLGRSCGVEITQIGRVLRAQEGISVVDASGSAMDVYEEARGFRHF